MNTRTIKENLRKRLAITATGLALAAASTFAHAHGDVTPQAVDTSSLKQLGEKSVDVLINMIQGKPAESVILKPEMIEGHSTDQKK